MILACVLVRNMRREGRGEGSEEGGKLGRVLPLFSVMFLKNSRQIQEFINMAVQINGPLSPFGVASG